MANRNQYRGHDGRFERCTVEKAFGIETNPGNQYCCSNCGHVFAPILVSGICPKCKCKEKTKVEIKEREN